MDSRDIHNLQEAYMEVVENQKLDEGYKTRNAAKIMNKKDSLRKKGDLESLGRAGDIERKLYRRDFSAQNPDVEERINKLREPKRSKLVSDNNKKKTFGNRLTRSDGQGIHDSYEYDLYDIVLSHLLDEGYAETPEAAEAIMVNMSEDWRESIVEEVIEEGYKKLPKGKIDRKIASKTVKAGKHYFASTWGKSDKSRENLEKANKLSSQAGKLLQISTERAPEASAKARGIKSKFEKEKRDKSKWRDELAKEQKKRYEERDEEMKRNMRRTLGGG